jgi:S1-C subfamily serine protease
MSDDWYIYKSNKAQGPLSESQVRGALAAGRIKPDTPLRRGLSGPWTPAERALAESVPATPARRKRSAPASGEINVVIEKASRLPLALAAVAGVVVLIGVLWGAFELGRRQQGPAVLAAHQDQATAGQKASVTLVDKAQPNTTLPNAPAATQSAIKPPASQTLAGDESDPAKSPPTTPPAALPSQLRPSAKPNQATLPASNSNVASPAGDRHPALVAKSNLESAASPLERDTRAPDRQSPKPRKPGILDKPAPRVANVSPTAKSPPIPATQPSATAPSVASAAPSAKPGTNGTLVANASAKPAVIVVPKAPAKDADVRALEVTARHSATAKEALALYNHFRATRTLPATQEDSFKANLATWEDRATQDLVRLGDKWVAAAEAAKAHEEAAQLFSQAYEMTRLLNFEEARKTLERASRVDPNSIAADFTLGILNSITPPSIRSPKTAAQHFQIVLRRIPGYVPALNNLAIAEIRQDKYADALHHLREAADRSPTSEEVTQNLGRIVSEAKLGRIRPNKSVLSEATRLYSKVITTKDGTRSELKVGWRYMPLVSPKEEREGLSRVQAPQSEAENLVAQGTGFVVEPHYVLTCRHVVDDLTLGRADKIELIDPTDNSHQRRLAATCVAVGEDDDLCLLRCDQLNAPSITLADKVPPRGTEILLMGFPGGSWFGLGLKTTRGVVTALPGDVGRIGGPRWLDFSRKLWYDAASSHGASGGAVLDEHANVVAVHSTGYRPGDDPSNAKYAGGVPSLNATAFLRTALPNFAHAPLDGPSLKWSDVDAKISPSVVLIVTGYRKVALAMNAKDDTRGRAHGHGLRSGEADIYDDHVCTACNGRGRIRCRNPGCLHGKIHDEVVVHDKINVGSNNRPVVITNSTTQSVHRMCPVCHGTGYVHCPFCSNGIDPTLR